MKKGFVRAAHDISDGGLAVTLAEMAFGGGLGFAVDLERVGVDSAGLALVTEGASRFVVEVPAESRRSFERSLARTPHARLGTVNDGGGSLRWGERTLAELELDPLYDRWRTGLGLP
jgi:phosphoribosylformylglycinamidine synthase